MARRAAHYLTTGRDLDPTGGLPARLARGAAGPPRRTLCAPSARGERDSPRRGATPTNRSRRSSVVRLTPISLQRGWPSGGVRSRQPRSGASLLAHSARGARRGGRPDAIREPYRPGASRPARTARWARGPPRWTLWVPCSATWSSTTRGAHPIPALRRSVVVRLTPNVKLRPVRATG